MRILSHTAKAGEEPLIVVPPSTTQEVSSIMRFCHKWRIPVTAYNGGTSLEGHLSPARGGICIDSQRIVNISKVRKNDFDATVQPAVGWEALNGQYSQEGITERGTFPSGFLSSHQIRCQAPILGLRWEQVVQALIFIIME